VDEETGTPLAYAANFSLKRKKYLPSARCSDKLSDPRYKIFGSPVREPQAELSCTGKNET
jgi:hypothetical protein